jgi:hypothetical protein
MPQIHHPGFTACLIFASLCPLSAQHAGAAEPESANRISFNTRFLFNVRTSFENLGGLPFQTDPGPATAGTDHIYDDGYNRVDASENEGGRTWFWGYDDSSQLPGNDTLVMTSTMASSDATVRDEHDEPIFGFEFNYAREIRRIGSVRWGVEAGTGYGSLAFSARGQLTGDAVQISDAYALNGVVPPAAPYRGSFEGPGVLIGDSPARTISTLPGGTTTFGNWRINARLYGLRLGPYIEVPCSDRIHCSISAGAALALVDSDFIFEEVNSVPGRGSSTVTGSDSQAGWLAGGYVAARVSVALVDQLHGFAGLRYEHLGRFSQTANGREARIDLRDSMIGTLGISYAF